VPEDDKTRHIALSWMTKPALPLLTAMLALACVLSGCHEPKAGSPSAIGGAQSVRNNSYSLLHQLLEQEKDVGMLRFIKREHSGVKNLVNKIAAASGAGSKQLEEFAKQDASIRLDDIQLPTGEAATRQAIASTEKKDLLAETGDALDLTLLLTQTQALNYAWHLAEVAGENEPQPERARALAGISKDMESLYNEAFVMLLSKTK
jgi:hypothetical protein